MKPSEKIKQSKLIATVENIGSKNFWRADKILCGDSTKPNEIEQILVVFFQQTRTTTDNERSEIFKVILQDTMEVHEYENLELIEHFEKVENETRKNELTKYCVKNKTNTMKI